jgi:F-type H+-transporting ATPase subunit gamma
MSKRNELYERIRALTDIKGILNAMKNLALMEVHKLGRFLSAQQRVVAGIEETAADFFGFHPTLLPPTAGAHPVFLLVGSERGFCGDFNESLLAEFHRHRQVGSVGEGDTTPLLISVGHKLAMKLGEGLAPDAVLAGPSVTEEVQSALLRVMEALRDLQQRHLVGARLDLVVLSHGTSDDGRRVVLRRPFREFGQPRASYSHPPILNVAPLDLAPRLLDQYLFAVLHEIFYTSLMAENRRRFQHMDQALQRLEKETVDLTRKHHILRQEEITQEIAVIMLSAEAVGGNNNNGGPAR